MAFCWRESILSRVSSDLHHVDVMSDAFSVSRLLAEGLGRSRSDLGDVGITSSRSHHCRSRNVASTCLESKAVGTQSLGKSGDESRRERPRPGIQSFRATCIRR